MVGLITGVHTDGNNYCVGEEDVMWRDCLNFLPQTSPRLPLGETETSLAKFIFSAHSSANIVSRKPVGVITLTTLFLMFIHLQKYIRQISENNEDLQPRAVWLDVLCLPCLLSVKNDQCFTSPLTTGRYSHHRGIILNVWGKDKIFGRKCYHFGYLFGEFFIHYLRHNSREENKGFSYWGKIVVWWKNIHPSTVIELLLHYFVSTQGWGSGCIVITTVRIPSHLSVLTKHNMINTIRYIIPPVSCLLSAAFS